MNKKDQEIKNFISVISAPARFDIILKLKKSCCVAKLWQELGQKQNLTSHHLKVLKKEKLVNSKREGKKVIYCLDKKVLNKKLSLLNKYLINETQKK